MKLITEEIGAFIAINNVVRKPSTIVHVAADVEDLGNVVVGPVDVATTLLQITEGRLRGQLGTLCLTNKASMLLLQEAARAFSDNAALLRDIDALQEENESLTNEIEELEDYVEKLERAVEEEPFESDIEACPEGWTAQPQPNINVTFNFFSKDD